MAGQHGKRNDDHYLKGILACAEFVLAMDFSREEEMKRFGGETLAAYGDHPEVAVALGQLGLR